MGTWSACNAQPVALDPGVGHMAEASSTDRMGSTVDYHTIVRRALGAVVDEWKLVDGDVWCMVSPRRHMPLRRQGWKLHLSAIAASSCQVLERAVPVLAEYR